MHLTSDLALCNLSLGGDKQLLSFLLTFMIMLTVGIINLKREMKKKSEEINSKAAF